MQVQTIEGIATSFQLKMQTTSDGNRFRLAIDVVYDIVNAGRFRECLVSTPFRVDSNRSKLSGRHVPPIEHSGDSEVSMLRKQVSTLASDKVDIVIIILLYCVCVS
jgi:hypothetical protein